MTCKPVPLWKEAPFLRLIIPFISGILLQEYAHLPAVSYWLTITLSSVALLGFAYIRSFSRYRYAVLAGVLIQLLLISAGGSLVHYKDIRHQAAWIGNFDQGDATYVVALDEPPVKKSLSYKAVCSIEYIHKAHRSTPVTGKVIVYFAAGPASAQLRYNTRIAFKKPLQDIRNMGNPGGFDYRQYCAFQQIYQQVYLLTDDYIFLGENKADNKTALYFIREKIVGILHTYIYHTESGLAEALLIGYKDDLDKDLVQSYTNTGVVHIIAISGMHLGLIYWLLTWLFSVFRRTSFRWLSPVLTLFLLWVFSLLTGGSPSVIRSAVMFTFIIVGGQAGKRSSVYNSLAASAFLLLCYNPFWLWDVGYQLSYLALLSIVIFMRPVYNWFHIENKLLDGVVKMFATTLAAQVLTMPISVYLFHQFPVYFLLTNLVAIPLSSLVVLGEIVICACSWIPRAAKETGTLVSWMISMMNRFIAFMEHLPFSMWGRLQITPVQTLLLYIIVVLVSIWLLEKKPRLLFFALCAVMGFMLIRTSSLVSSFRQKKMLVYNVPKHQAIDLVSGRHSVLITDSSLLQNQSLLRNTVQPAGIFYRFSHLETMQSDSSAVQGFYLAGKKILLCHSVLQMNSPGKPVQADIVVITGNPQLVMEQFIMVIRSRLVVFDASNQPWRVSRWIMDCKKAGLPYHAVAEKGAFVFSAD